MYVPNFDSDSCVVVYDSDTIRVYDTEPVVDTSVHYTAYLFNSHYLSYEGEQYFSDSLSLPSCSSNFDSIFYHRTDIAEIIFIFIVFIGLNWFLLSKLVKTLLHGGKIL